MIAIAIFFVLHWYLSLFLQTFFHHRYAAHRQFSMSPFWERFFYVMSWIIQGSTYLSPRTYAMMHRMHHAYADTGKDPHTPINFSNAVSMILDTQKTYRKIHLGETKIEEKYKRNLPEWASFDKMAHSMVSKVAWGTLYTFFYLYFAPTYWLLLLLPVHYLMAAFHGDIINWGAHKYGYRNYEMDNTSTNLFPVDLIMVGEGLHNNHHKYPSDPNFSKKWFELDPSWWVIRLLDKLGVISLKAKG